MAELGNLELNVGFSDAEQVNAITACIHDCRSALSKLGKALTALEMEGDFTEEPSSTPSQDPPQSASPPA